jgi:hypothetical protein
MMTNDHQDSPDGPVGPHGDDTPDQTLREAEWQRVAQLLGELLAWYWLRSKVPTDVPPDDRRSGSGPDS